MKYIVFSFILVVSVGVFTQKFQVFKNFSVTRDPANVPREVQDLYNRFVQNNYIQSEESAYLSYENFVSTFNSKNITDSSDWIDAFLESLPDSAKRHYTFVHRSYSIQSGTPMSPRVILFTPDAQTIMTFNSRIDEHGRALAETTGDQAIEVIQWNTQKLAWDFIELTLNVLLSSPGHCPRNHGFS